MLTKNNFVLLRLVSCSVVTCKVLSYIPARKEMGRKYPDKHLRNIKCIQYPMSCAFQNIDFTSRLGKSRKSSQEDTKQYDLKKPGNRNLNSKTVVVDKKKIQVVETQN